MPLTTLAVPMRRIGELSAEILLDRIDGMGPVGLRHVLRQPELVVRASCP